MKAYLQLFRWNNAILAGITSLLGVLASPIPLSLYQSIAPFFILVALVSLGNAHNDIVDLDSDSINQPNRPLLTGAISIPQAWWSIFILTSISLSLAFFHSQALLFLSLSTLATLWFYNSILKATPLLGNLCVSLLCASAIYYPSFPHISLSQHCIAFFAFCYTLTREITKDIEDYSGDLQAHKNTTAVHFGIAHSQKMAIVLLLLSLFSSALPSLLGFFPPLFWWPWSLAVLPLSLRTLYLLKKQNWKSAQKCLKQAMSLGMIAIFVALLSR